jgi:hypothetical protein
MLSQLLVATLIAAVCVALGLIDWVRARGSHATAKVYADRGFATVDGRRRIGPPPTHERVTRLTALTGYRRAVRDDGGWPTLYRSGT